MTAETSGFTSPENSEIVGSTVTVTEVDHDSFLDSSLVSGSWFSQDKTLMDPAALSSCGDPEDGTLDQLPLFSRQSLRKMHRHSRGGYQENRVRKSHEQVAYLRRLYAETGGKFDRNQRKRAMRATGLSWIQIYKWLFDRQMKDAANYAFVSSHPAQIFKVVGRNGQEIGARTPIFRIERVSRSSE